MVRDGAMAGSMPTPTGGAVGREAPCRTSGIEPAALLQTDPPTALTQQVVDRCGAGRYGPLVTMAIYPGNVPTGMG